jgi:hypothetical protein
MSIRIALLLVLIANKINAQTSFEKGYIVQNNEIIECFIKYSNPKSNPNEIFYKLKENGDELTANLYNTSEFGVENKFKFVRQTVEIDQSPTASNSLNWSVEPQNVSKTVFLKVLVEGKVKLFQYESANLSRFYIQEGDNIEQLIYKRYMIDNFKIEVNNFFKRQLFRVLSCGVEKKEIDYISYHHKDLSNLIVKHNNCLNDTIVIDYTNRFNKPKFNIHAKIGFQNSSMKVEHNPPFMYDPIYRASFDSKNSMKFGAEIELVLPYNGYNFSFFIDPSFQQFKGETVNDLNSYNVTVDYKSLEIPIGLRYFLYNKKISKIFLNTGLVVDIPFNSTLIFEDGYNRRVAQMKNGYNFMFGFGYRLNNKYSLEFRHQTKRNNLEKNYPFPTRYGSTSLLLSYNLL